MLKPDMEQVPRQCDCLLLATLQAPPVLPDVQNEAQLALSLRIGVEAGTARKHRTQHHTTYVMLITGIPKCSAMQVPCGGP